MNDDKPFSMVEILLGFMIIGSLDTAEFLLDPTGLGLLLMPAEIGVGLFTAFWFMYKGGSRMETRLMIWLLGSIVEFAPIIDMFPLRTTVFLISVHLANKDAERDAAGQKQQGGGDVNEEEPEEEEEEEPEEEYAEDEGYEEEEEEELPEAA